MHREAQTTNIYIKPKLKILKLENQITKLDTEMNWSSKKDEREREETTERETDLVKGGERERERKQRLNLGWAWTDLTMAHGGG